MAHILCLKTCFAKIDNHVVEGRFWSGIEQRDAVVRFERGGGDDSGTTQLSRVQDVNLHLLRSAAETM